MLPRATHGLGGERRIAASRLGPAELNILRDLLLSQRPNVKPRGDSTYAGGKDRAGAGLGLAICRLIVTRHGGRIWAENTHLGPMFSFVLPVGRAGTAPPADVAGQPGFTFEEVA